MNDIITSRIFWLLLSKSFQRQIAMKYDKTFAKTTMKCAKENYYNILHNNIPLVRKHNPKLVDILLTALIASIYKAGNGKISITQMESVMTESLESSDVFCKSFSKADHFSKEWQEKRNLEALHSQQRKYPSDFVCDFIYGKTFDEYGINYSECAIYNLLKHEGCPELTPIFCKFDYIMAKHMKATLKRTKTLVTGGDCCDFWYKRNSKVE